MMIKAFDGIKSKDDKRICCRCSKSFFNKQFVAKVIFIYLVREIRIPVEVRLTCGRFYDPLKYLIRDLGYIKIILF